MHAATTKALQDPTVKRGLTDHGVDYELSSPEALQAFVEREVARWAKVIKENKIVAGE
jgi:tripartite-type tricarboxylate transporter receptor subunit TctC